MHHTVGHVQEEGTVRIAADEADSMLGVLGGQLLLILAGDLRIDDPVPLYQGQVRPALDALFHGQVGHTRMIRPHVIGIGQAKVLIKTMLQGQELGMMSQMPLAVDGRGIALLFAHLGQCHLLCVDAMRGTGPQGPVDPHATMVTPGHQGRT